MAATGTVLCQVRVVGLGAEIDARKKYDLANAPEAALQAYKTFTTASTPEMLNLGDVKVSVVDGIWFRAIGNDFHIDPCVSTGGAASDFRRRIIATDSEPIYFRPGIEASVGNGVCSIAIVCSTAVPYEYVVIGQTS